LLNPPAIRTVPSSRNVALWLSRAVAMAPGVTVKTPVMGVGVGTGVGVGVGLGVGTGVGVGVGVELGVGTGVGVGVGLGVGTGVGVGVGLGVETGVGVGVGVGAGVGVEVGSGVGEGMAAPAVFVTDPQPPAMKSALTREIATAAARTRRKPAPLPVLNFIVIILITS
jgi:hypothetical protein